MGSPGGMPNTPDAQHPADPAAGEVKQLVRRAAEAQPGWADVAPAERGTLLRRAADAVEAVADRLARLTTEEMGKPPADARAGVDAGVATLRQYAELGPLHRGRSLQGGHDAVDLMAPRPRGVVAAITPWNDPVAVPCGLVGAALVTGNTVVLKPSERTPRTGAELAAALAAVLPDDVLLVAGGTAAWARRWREADVDLVAHVGLDGHRTLDRPGLRGARHRLHPRERRQRPARRGRRRRPGLGGRPGGARGVRERRADLHVGGADLRRRGRRRRLPRGAGRGRGRLERAAAGRPKDAGRRPRARHLGGPGRRPGAHRWRDPRRAGLVLPGDRAVRLHGRDDGDARGDVRPGGAGPRRRLVRRGAGGGRRVRLRPGRDGAHAGHGARAGRLARAAGRHGQGQRASSAARREARPSRAAAAGPASATGRNCSTR